MKPNRSRRARCRGFALVVTLSLMILLTVIAVGLLTLASVSLRSSATEGAMTVARANARLSLLLAIGDLQKQLGPDTRVSATADQIGGTDGSESTAPAAQRQWAGAYRSWPDAQPDAARPEPEFLQWFVSGDPKKVGGREFATTAASGSAVDILTENAVGPAADPVRVPLLTQTLSPGKTANGFAWWASDLNAKALIGPAREIPTTFAEVRNDQQAAPAMNLRAAKSGSDSPFALVSVDDERLEKMTSWKNAGLLATNPAQIGGLFHDLTTSSSGLLTNVRAGGFRKDLSMELERSSAPSSTGTAFYSFGGETGINLQELWSYYNLYKDVRRTGGAKFTTGGSFSSGTPYLQVAANADACKNDDYFYYKQPVIISYQLAFSLQTRVVQDASTGNRPVTRLHIVADPIVTLWNPLDIAVVIPTTAFITVKYWQIPYDIDISVDGAAFKRFSMATSLYGKKKDANFLSIRFGEIQQIVLKPGEVLKLSQPGNTTVKGDDYHKIAGKAGFNYGGGVAVPVGDVSGNSVDLSPASTIRYKLNPNDLTCGATTSDGNSVFGGPQHTRHFSLYHHELYVGVDRDTNSLGIGTMAIDWDFGNKRLLSNQRVRTDNQSGTKASSARLYANKFPEIFPTIPTSRTIGADNLAADKQPILLVSFNAKTEAGSKTGTRFLSRFNPKAFHVDFYDLSATERDLLPYEFSVVPLTTWKTPLTVSTPSGNAYFGGSLEGSDGSSFVTTHTVPREPLVSLGQFQYSFANGFDSARPRGAYGTLSDREPMMPQIAHAIGNSVACPVLAKNKIQGTIDGGRPLADHSYLANNALWDQWFLSGVSPQIINTYSKPRSQKAVLSEFLDGTGKLPVIRYKAGLNGQDPRRIAATYFAGSTPRPAASTSMASLISVEGMFNVNSTSIEAWKSVLGGRDGRPVVVRDESGRETIQTGAAGTPVAALLAPLDKSISPGTGNVTPQDGQQWVGRRVLDDKEIDSLARAIVTEVRKRGPFLCLSDFVNRRPGSNDDLAKSGAIQSALDSRDTAINAPYQSNGRSVPAATSSRFAFPAAETGPLSYGSPGVVKQADILTPIAPILSARSDSFLVRGYGQKTDASGKVIARAWCEAVVRRTAAFVDPADAPDAAYGSISTINKSFGRRFEIVSFRWLNPSEA